MFVIVYILYFLNIYTRIRVGLFTVGNERQGFGAEAPKPWRRFRSSLARKTTFTPSVERRSGVQLSAEISLLCGLSRAVQACVRAHRGQVPELN